MLAADRFYGTAQLIEWCQKAGWSYRIRLKGNLTLLHKGGELTTGEAAKILPDGLVQAELYGSGVFSNIGILHDKGHKEPWIIAMDVLPTRYRTLDYGMRWGIESMFSDFKTRGFGLMQSQIQRPERLERLILVMSIALYWAVSCGMFAEQQVAERGIKKRSLKQALRSLTSLFKTGLPFIRRCLVFHLSIPLLWAAWDQSWSAGYALVEN
jgi:hypothetical protein